MSRGRVGCLRAIWIAGFLALTAAAGGCDDPAKSQAQAQAQSPSPGAAKTALPTVTASKPIQRNVVEWDEYTGRFDAVETVEVRARVSGYLTEVHFKDGQTVMPGDLLFVIDQRPFERALEQAQAELLQAKTKIENANLDVVRGKPLVERRIISEKTFDDRESIVRDAQAAAKVAEAKVKTAELDLSFTRITSPIAGRISRNQVSIGNWVSAGGAANATLLTSIVSQDPIRIYFDVSENNYLKYKRLTERGERAGAAELGAAVEVALPDEHGYPHEGRLDFLDNRLDQDTGTLRARAVLANASGLFSPGMFARVRVAGSSNYTALVLPEEAIGTDQTIKFVYTVAEDGTVSRANIKLGPVVEGGRIVREGIAAGDWVIVRGVQRARPGQKVAPTRLAGALSENAPPAPQKGP